jgi:DNA invertase Pin-like site-specific DNA recombinase
MLKEHYEGDLMNHADKFKALCQKMKSGAATADEILSAYLKQLYDIHGSYEAAARAAGLDRRTVKKKITDLANTPSDK